MNTLDDFRNELGRELVAAAYRTNKPPARARTSGLRPSRVIGAVATLVVVAVAALGVLVARPDSASAQVFRIRTVETGTILDVIDIVEDPDEVVDQLQNEIDLAAEMFAVPVPNQLVGQLVAVASSGDSMPVTVFNDVGTVERVELPTDFEGTLLIEYGRPADGAEFYAATLTDPICADLYGAPPADIIDTITSLATEVQFEVVDKTGRVTVDVPVGQLPAAGGLVDITYLNSQSLLATFAAQPPPQPAQPACQ